MTLPLRLRNWLAELILAALRDVDARRALAAAAAVSADARTGLADLPGRLREHPFEERDGGLVIRSDWADHAAELRERSRRAWRAIGDRALDPPEASPATALAAAALLFDAGLYFEVHELLEPHWVQAGGVDREALQGLIQIAVGFQHLANGNVTGARALLGDGSVRTQARRLHGLDLDPFTRAVRRCLEELIASAAAREFDWATVPRFPRGPETGPGPLAGER